MSDMLAKFNFSTTRSLINSDYDLRVPFLRTTIGHRCFSYKGAKLRNGVPKKTKNYVNFKRFYESHKMIIKSVQETSIIPPCSFFFVMYFFLIFFQRL